MSDVDAFCCWPGSEGKAGKPSVPKLEVKKIGRKVQGVKRKAQGTKHKAKNVNRARRKV